MNHDIQTVSVTMDKRERNWGMACHLSALCGYIIPFGNVIGPLVIWLLKKDELAFVDDQGREALNFQLTLVLAFMVSFILIFVLIGFVMTAILCVYALIMIVYASVKASEGVRFRYPMTVRFFK